MTMENEQSAIALLLFRVGPVLCCAPADPVQTIIAPPKLTHPPGSSAARPGIFYHAEHVVSVNELRHRFGLAEADREQPGRLIITLQDEGFIAYWVDEIIEVIDTPQEGWSAPPTHLPRGVFSRTLLLNEKIYLCADFHSFENLPECGDLNQFLHAMEDRPAASDTDTIEADSPSSPPVSDIASVPPEDNTIEETAQALTPDLPDEAGPVTDEAPTEARAPEQDIADNFSPAQDSTVPLQPAKSMDKEGENGGTDEDDTEIVPAADAPLPAGSASNAPPAAVETVPPPVPPVDTIEDAAIYMDDTVQEPEVTDTANVTDTVNEDDFTPFAPQTDPAGTPEDSPDEPASAATTTDEVKLSPSEKAARLKEGFLNPVPATVPESEQAPPPPPFPWRKLAAAILLFATLGGIGIYSLWSGSSPPRPGLPVTPTQQTGPEHKQNHAASQASNDVDTDTATESATLKEPANTTATNGKEDRDDYQAEIKQDEKGVTIVLQTPDKVPALKVTKSSHAKKRAPTMREEVIHTVVKGDTLWDIAAHYVNDPYKYPQLARLSKIKNPDLIYPGNRVLIKRKTNAQK